jgi:hypothetical protein
VAASRQRVAVIAVGIVVPIAVLAACLCLPRREHARPGNPPAAEQPVVAVAPVIPDPQQDERTQQRVHRFHELMDQARAQEDEIERTQRVEEALEIPQALPPQLPMPPAQVEKPLAAIALPARADEPLLPAAAPPPAEKPAVREGCPKPPAGEYGTAVRFAKDPTEAAKLATTDNKLMVIFTISGNFEDSKFT